MNIPKKVEMARIPIIIMKMSLIGHLYFFNEGSLYIAYTGIMKKRMPTIGPSTVSIMVRELRFANDIKNTKKNIATVAKVSAVLRDSFFDLASYSCNNRFDRPS